MGIRIRSVITGIGLFLFCAMAWAESHGDIQEIIDECATCHGDKGASKDKAFPIIGGMSAFYLEEQLRAYRDEARPCDKTEYPSGPHKGETTDMCKEAKELTEEQMRQVAEYFAEQPFVPADQEYDAELAAQGAKIHERQCSKCHSEGGSLAFDDAGILAGQWRPYLEETFEAYRAGKRWQPEKMAPEIEKLADSDIKALIEYYVSQGEKRFGQGK